MSGYHLEMIKGNAFLLKDKDGKLVSEEQMGKEEALAALAKLQKPAKAGKKPVKASEEEE